MPQPYNMTEVMDATNFFEMFKLVDTNAGGIIFPGFLIGVFVVVLVILMRNSPPQESFFSSSMITTLLSIGLFAAGATSLFWTVGFGALAAFSGVGLYIQNKT